MLSILVKTEIVFFQLKMKSGCVYLKFDLELNICVTKDRHRFYIREACFTLSNSSESNNFIAHLLLYRTFWLDFRMSSQHCQSRMNK